MLLDMSRIGSLREPRNFCTCGLVTFVLSGHIGNVHADSKSVRHARPGRLSPSKSSTTISDRIRVRGLRENGVLYIKRDQARGEERPRFYLSFSFLRALMLGLPIARAQPSTRLDDSEGRARNQTRAITDPSTPWPSSSSKFLPRLQHSPTFQQKVR
jgi:hypothetical protein